MPTDAASVEAEPTEQVATSVNTASKQTAASSLHSNLTTLAPTPIKLEPLKKYLKIYPHPDANVLMDGFEQGFSLDFSGPQLSYIAKNHHSANQLPGIMKAKLAKEISLGRIAGPFSTAPLQHLRCSPIGLVPKKEPNEYRFIHDLSTYPKENSVNMGIDPESCSVKYTTLDDVIQQLIKCGKGALMAKSDIKSAFRLLPIKPAEYNLLGFTFEHAYFINRCLPMGASCSCKKWEILATFLQWVVEYESGKTTLNHYIDDFIFYGKPGTRDTQILLDTFHDICHSLGVPIAVDKIVPPTTCLKFLGLELDTVSQEIRVPHEKLEITKVMIRDFLGRDKVTLRMLQSLIGSLQFLCRAIAPGRPFLRRLSFLTKKIKKPDHWIRLAKGAKGDLQTWLTFLDKYNGISLFRDIQWSEAEQLKLYTDSSHIAMGIYFNGRWAYQEWPEGFVDRDTSIAFLELFPIAVALVLWAPELANKKVMFKSDNMSVVHIINKMVSDCPRIMRVVRFIVLKTLDFNISVRASHVEGACNISDSLSRLKITSFITQAQEADPYPTPIPSTVWQI